MIISGYDLKELVDLLKNKNAVAAQVARGLYTGEQQELTTKYLDDPYKGIKDWRKKKIVPICRNITEQIIDKSGLLFKDGLPAFALTKKNKVHEASKYITEYVDYYDFQSRIQALDTTVRLLKSAILLIGWDTEEGRFTFDILHHGNSFVIHDGKLRPQTLIHRTGNKSFQVITKEFFYDLREDEVGNVKLVSEQENTFGFIPIALFHDKNAPIYGFTHNVDTMLSDFNFALNKQLSLLDYSLAWKQQSTLFSNVRLPEQLTLGPGSVVEVEQADASMNVFIEYRTPDIDVNTINDILTNWANMVAGAYSVRLEADTSNITSGFQLVVKENSNLELRKERQRPFEAGFSKMWDVMSRIIKIVHNIDLSQYAFLVNFPTPSLPINEKEVEEIWSIRIDNKRATVKDYLMEVKGMTSDEADKKIIELNGGGNNGA